MIQFSISMSMLEMFQILAHNYIKSLTKTTMDYMYNFGEGIFNSDITKCSDYITQYSTTASVI